jgi:hypothetical protein
MKTTIDKAQNDAISLNRELVENTHDINNTLTTAKNVSPMFAGHYFNMESGEHGLQTLITEILSAKYDEKFTANVGETKLRNVAIAAGMFTSEIIEAVEARFSSNTNRYKYVRAYLSVIMTKNGKVGKIKLTNNEDKNRPKHIARPRFKWFLIE